MNMAQALWLILGFAQRNNIPDPKEKGKGKGSMDDMFEAILHRGEE